MEPNTNHSITVSAASGYQDPIYITQKGAVSGQDSTQALIDAISEGLAQNRPVCIDSGTFLINSGRVTVNIPAGKSLTIFGMGSDSILKRASGLDYDFKPLLWIRSDNIGHTKSVVIRDLFIDGNARENPIPAGQGAYYFEHCADIRIDGRSHSSLINDVSISNIGFADPVADCIYFAGSRNCYVKNASISNMYVLSRNRTRGDITTTGGLQTLNVTDCRLQVFIIELNNPYDGGTMVCNISGLVCDQAFAITGDGKTFLNAVNIKAYLSTIRLARGSISNSTFIPISGNQHFRFNRGITLTDCTFLYPVTNGAITPMLIMPDAPEDKPARIHFRGCKFEVHGEDSVASGGLINFEGAVLVENVDKTHTIFENCWFDGKAYCSVYANRCGSLTIRDCDLAGKNFAIYSFGSGMYGLKLTIEGCSYERVNGAFMRHSGSDQFELYMRNLYLDYSKFGGFTHESSNRVPKTIMNSRILYSNSAPTGGGYTGDTVRLISPAAGQPCEWTATTTSATAATWKISKTLDA